MNAADISNYTKQGTIPLASVPSQQFQIALDGQNCTISVFQKDDYVYMDLYVDNVLAFAGMIALDRVGIKPTEADSFKGQLWFEDTTGTQNPQYTGFGNRWVLCYGK